MSKSTKINYLLFEKVKAAVDAQANDETLWPVNIPGQEFTVSIGQAYVQQSLRWLHRVIEDGDEAALKAIIDQSKGDI